MSAYSTLKGIPNELFPDIAIIISEIKAKITKCKNLDILYLETLITILKNLVILKIILH